MPEPSHPNPSEAREALARQQAALVRAVRGDDSELGDFDSKNLHLTSQSLARKRARSVQKSWPVLSAALGDQFTEIFGDYAGHTPLPEHAGADGYQFAAWLRSNGKLPNAALIELLRWEIAHGARLRLGWDRRTWSVLFLYRRRTGVGVLRVGLAWPFLSIS